MYIEFVGEKMKKTVSILIMILLLLGLCGCEDFEDTPETDAAFAAYEEAVKQTIAHKKGYMSVVTRYEDTVVEKTESLGVIEYSFSTDQDNKVTFERNDFTNGQAVASYRSDGKKAYQLEMESGEWVDVTEANGQMLEHDQNIFNTLSLFRIDSGLNYSKRFFESVSMEEAEGEKIITFVIKNEELNSMFELSDEKEIRREMTGQTRKFYVNEKGDIYQITIDTTQNITYKGDSGTLKNLITVTMNYEN